MALRTEADRWLRVQSRHSARSHASFFMNRFRKVGLIKYAGRIRVPNP
jgi:hypothetical protein